LDDIGSELINILNHLNIPQIVIFGEGAGANIGCRFAIEYPSRVHGLVLVHPTGTTAGFMEIMKDKINNWKLIHKGMNADAEAYLIWHRFGHVCFLLLKIILFCFLFYRMQPKYVLNLNR
jgi:pimeloyl-ACP methyl ester carboxylesterase